MSAATPTPSERFDKYLTDAGDDNEHLAHVADHLGMGTMDKGLVFTPQNLREFWQAMTSGAQLNALDALDDCPW